MKLYIKELLREGLLNENALGKHLIVVDVQPEYENYFGNLAHNLFAYINENHDSISNITFLYNGEDTLGMVSEHEYRNWLYENGLDEEISYDVRLYDKGYAFFRYCIDNDIEYQSIVELVKYMYENEIYDSRDLTAEFWKSFVAEHGDEDIKDLLSMADDCVSVPDLMDFLNNFNNIVLVGGGVNECLKEVEIALDALGKQYTVWNEYTY